MQATQALSFAEAAVAWIRDRSTRLSPSTERAYRGEIARMAQFFAAKYGELALGAFTQDHWQDYVEELQGEREHVVSCRDVPLATSSAVQAIRIGAAFLRWARDEGLLVWAPRTVRTHEVQATPSTRRQPLVDLSINAEALHPALSSMLMKEPSSDTTPAALRAQLAVGLAYWGGLRSSDIAALRKGDISTSEDALELRHPRLRSAMAIHGNVAATWNLYRLARELAGETLTRRSPVLAALGTNEPISPWCVWALISQHIEAITGVEKLYSAQSLRRARVAAMGKHCAADINKISAYTHRTRVDFETSA